MSSNIEEGRGFFGIIIPAEILDSTELSVGEKFVYGFIASFSKACFLSNDAIASRLGVSEHTVSRAIKTLADMEYIYVEFVNNNSAARRIYAVFDNPKKLKYLATKGMFNNEKFSTGLAKMANQVSQNGKEVSQNGIPQNRGEVCQNGNHRNRIKEEESARAREKAVETPSQRPRRADFATQEAWEDSFYKWNTTPA